MEEFLVKMLEIEHNFMKKYNFKKNILSDLIKYSRDRGFSEDRLFLEFKSEYEIYNPGKFFMWDQWVELKKKDWYFKNILEQCAIYRKEYFLNIGMNELVRKEKVNSSIYLAFMQNEFGWNKEKVNSETEQLSEVKVTFVDETKKQT